MNINGERLWRNLDILSGYTDPERPWTRRSFSPVFIEARQWLRTQFEAAGMTVRVDAGGNLIGRLAGRNPALPPILTGSHSDTVPSGGRYDGMLGVLGALEVVLSLRDRGERLAHDLEVIDFLAEEPSEFGLSCIGSRTLAGKLAAADLDCQRPDGMTLAEGLRYVGGDPDDLASAYRAPGSIAAYVELHIEQAKLLATRRLDIGIVTGIVAIRRYRVTVQGRADHAGQTPMAGRADALVAAARIIDGAYRDASAATSDALPLVATVGRIDKIWPNAANAVPGAVTLTLECRCLIEAKAAHFLDGLLARLAPDFAALGVTVAVEQINDEPATPCTPSVQALIADVCDAAGYTHCPLASGAGHDGSFVAHAGPFGMIFTPCRDGRSHTPEEWLEPKQAAIGADVLYRTIQRLDQLQ